MRDPNKLVRVGVVGCGVVATAYYLPMLRRMPEVTLAAVCDSDRSRAASCVRLFGAERAFDDFHAMLDTGRLDCVFVLTGPGTHARFACDALNAGCHVLLQKPMALNLDDARRIVETARARNRKLLVEPSAHSPLDPYYRTIRAIVRRGVLGKPYWFIHVGTGPDKPHPSLGGNPYGVGAFYAKDSGGELFDMPYVPNQIVATLGPCKSVSGLAKLSQPDRHVVPDTFYTQFLERCTDPDQANYWREVVRLPRSRSITMEAPDNVFSLYEMADGTTGVFHVGRLFHPNHPGASGGGFHVLGTEGNLVYYTGGHYCCIYTTRRDLLPEADADGWFRLPHRATTPSVWPIPTEGDFHYYHESTRHLIDCIRHDQPVTPTPEWGLHITEMMHGALVSSETGRRYDMTTTLDW
jgi:predicted dehydrogenase